MIRKSHSGEVVSSQRSVARRAVADTGCRFNASAPDEDVHRLVSDVEQLIGIHADALFREPNLMVTVAAAALAGRSGA